MKITENSQSQFINYVLDFYGQGGIYPLADPVIHNKFVEYNDVLKAFKKYKTLLDASIKLEKELKNNFKNLINIKEISNIKEAIEYSLSD